MFQRLQKGLNLDFLDNKIAEEQEKQKQQQTQKGGSPAKRTPSTARRGNGRTDSPSKRTGGSRLQVPDGKGGDGAQGVSKGPDPDDFVIGDDASDVPTRSTTPAPMKEGGNAAPAEEKDSGAKKDAVEKGKEPQALDEDELPLEVRQKLARLDKLTAKYQDLLRNYRNAHAHVAAIEPFEATLREHTPLTSISDPGALIEFLNQRSLQSDMVMQELKRVSGEHNEAVKERDQLKAKLEEAEKKAKEAFDDAAGLRKERDEPTTSKNQTSDPLGASEANQQSSSSEAKLDDDTFFSYEEEVSRAKAEDDQESSAKIEEIKAEYEGKIAELQTEMKERQDYINELSTENVSMRDDLESMRRDLDIASLDLDAMKNKHEVRDRGDNETQAELATLKEQLEQARTERQTARDQEQEAAASLAQTEHELVNLQKRLKEYQQTHDATHKELTEKAAGAEEKLKKYQGEPEQQPKSGGKSKLQVLEDLLKTLRGQLNTAVEAKKETEQKFNDMQLEINRLESESDSNANTIRHLRQSEAATDSLKKRLIEAEREREEAQKVADTKKGHEARIASLRSELKRAQKDRDTAYQMIIECGKCPVLETDKEQEITTPAESSTPSSRSRMGSETTEVSTQTTEASSEAPPTPLADGSELAVPGETKKKNKKKKSKSKKKAPAEGEAATSTENVDLTVEDLLLNPELAPDVLLKRKFGDNPMVPMLIRMVETFKERNEADDNGQDDVRHHLEDLIEQRDQTIQDNAQIVRAKNDQIMELEQKVANAASSEGSEEQVKQIESLKNEIAALHEQVSEKDVQISKLQERLQGEGALWERIDELLEEVESAKDDMIEHGKAAADAKADLKDMKESRQKLQQEFDELQVESDGYFKKMKDAEAQKQTLTTSSRNLETEIQELKTKMVSSDEMEGLKEQLQNAIKEKESLKALNEACEKRIEELKAEHSANGAEVDAKHKTLSAEFDTLRAKSTELEKELAAANDLAQTRFKDLTAIREQYNKVQPELKRLREESAELKNVKIELEKANASLKKLEAKEKDLRSEITEYKSQMTEKDTEIATLREKSKKSDERSTALEESYETARKDLEKSEKTRDEAVDARERLEANTEKLEDEVKKSRSTFQELDNKAKQSAEEAGLLREQLDIKTAECASANSYMDDVKDQSREVLAQMKETKQRCENLEEELEDAQRLLSERSREGEKMRRLLAEAEGRAESAVKEMRERMDLAIEERDRAEDEASTIGRRKAREIEDLKTKLRDAEREASRATEAKQDAERRERDFKGRQQELERRAAQAQEEINEVRTAMAQLRDTLDETERQSHELEKQKQELRRMVDEKDARLEKLTKSSKFMAEELRAAQAVKRQAGSSTPSRSSIESSRVTSPVPKTSNGSGADAGIDYVYLKNVLLQFMETKEKKHQMQFVPVLRMLLHFTPEEEQKWQAVVQAAK